VVAKLYQKWKRGIRLWLLRTLPGCKDMAPVMSQSLDRKLRLRERTTLRLHLWVCLRCVRYLEQLTVIRNLLRRSQSLPLVEEISPELTSEVRERIRGALEHRQP
jgi:hypothetical protein